MCLCLGYMKPLTGGRCNAKVHCTLLRPHWHPRSGALHVAVGFDVGAMWCEPDGGGAGAVGGEAVDDGVGFSVAHAAQQQGGDDEGGVWAGRGRG